MNDEIVELMRQRDAALHNYMAMPTKSPELFQNYKKLRNKVTKELRQVRRNYYTDKIENAQGCPKRIWKTLKELLPRRQNAAPSSVNYNGESFTDSFDIASAFNTHFTSIANNLLDKQGIQRGAATEWKNLQKPNLNRPAFHIPPITQEFVSNQIKHMSSAKSTGLDDISVKILKHSSTAIVPSLTKLFNLSISTKTVPDEWKQAKVVPLFKSGNIDNCSNYRPITYI